MTNEKFKDIPTDEEAVIKFRNELKLGDVAGLDDERILQEVRSSPSPLVKPNTELVLKRAEIGFVFVSCSNAKAVFPPMFRSIAQRLRTGTSLLGTWTLIETVLSIAFPLLSATIGLFTRRRQTGCVRLHRDVLRSTTQTREEPDAVARRVRTAIGYETRRCLKNSGLFRFYI